MAENFQREGSISNAQVGRDFERIALQILVQKGLNVSINFPVEVGANHLKKSHSFDLGSDSPPVIVECKSHKWTAGNNVPSAKITVWNEAMYYFQCTPKQYRKIFFVLRDERSSTGETLAAYYVRTYEHLITEHFEKYPDIDVLATEEIALESGLAGSSRISNTEITEKMDGTLDDVADNTNFDRIEESAELAGLVAAGREAIKVLGGKQSVSEAGINAVKATSVAATSTALVAYLFG